MEHNCPNCGARVEDGTPFCPKCNAPQIRVSNGEKEPATPPLPPGTPGELQPPAEPVTPQPRQDWPPVRPVVHVQSGSNIDWKTARRVSVLMGVAGGIGSFFGIFGFLLVLAAGGITITVYQHRAHAGHISTGNGFRMGSMTGLISGLLYCGMIAIVFATTQGRSFLRARLQEQTAQAISNTPDAATQQTLQRLAEFLATNTGLAVLMGVGCLFATLLFIVLAGLGGSIGASLFGRHEPQRS